MNTRLFGEQPILFGFWVRFTTFSERKVPLQEGKFVAPHLYKIISLQDFPRVHRVLTVAVLRDRKILWLR